MSLPFDSYIAAGLSVIPVGMDKRPLISTWEPFQKRLPTKEEASIWPQQGIAIVAGEVSGGLTCIDIDVKHDPAGSIGKEFFEAAKDLSFVSKLVIQKTTSHGWHVLFRSPVKRGCEKLITAPGKKEAMIEIKGEGGYFVCAPTPGWEVTRGSLLEIPTLTHDEAMDLITCAWLLERNETPLPAPVQKVEHNGKSPFDDYSERTTWEEMENQLQANGWRRVRERGENVHYCRPDKKGSDTSATLHKSRRTFFPFTSSSEFEPRKAYSPVGVYTMLNHAGDFKKAARALVDAGFGEKRSPTQKISAILMGVKESDPKLVEEVIALYHQPYYPGESTGWLELDKILRIEKGQLNILFGVPSHGKSSFMDALLCNLVFNSKWRAVVHSPENKSAAYHASKLCEILQGKPMYGQGRLTENELTAAARLIAEKFVFLSALEGGTKLDHILEKIKDLKPDIAVVDPWNRIDHSREGGLTETEYIGNALAKTSAMTKALNLSFWFVVHPQKLRRDKNGDIIRPGFYEVSGSAHWANMADNGILVWRDFENKLTEIETVKVRYRHNGTAGTVKMRFDRPSGRFFSLTAGETFLGNSQLPVGDR